MVFMEKIQAFNLENNKKNFSSSKDFKLMYEKSLKDTDLFWHEQAQKFITWDKNYTKVSNYNFNKANIKWFEDGKLNVCYNCIDRHLEKRADKLAIIWESNDSDQEIRITYQQLHDKVCRLANGLKSLGIKKGDRVCIYLPMIVESLVSMLACARIGAIHSVVFAGFSSNALKDRILDLQCKLVITADQSVRGSSIINIKDYVDEAIKECDYVKNVLVVKRTGTMDISWDKKKDILYTNLIRKMPLVCKPESMGAEDSLFILYTSGSTNKPKGVVHTCGGYLLYSGITFKYVFNYKDKDIYWCAADIGWITGHSYICYGPLLNGATTLLFEGVPTHPNYSRYWQIVDKYSVSIFYTSPTILRELIRAGDVFLEDSHRKSLRVLGSVGEPINPEVWKWYFEKVGNSKCAISDTWWQTETGGHVIAPLAYNTPLKPGSATVPFFGIKADIIDEKGNVLKKGEEGTLVLNNSWPGQIRGLYNDKKRFYETYFKPYPGRYLTGDGAKKDKDGYYWITGRIDDVLNVSGHRLGTAEIESALIYHKAVSEAAVVGVQDDMTGEAIYAYVCVLDNIKITSELTEELRNITKKMIGRIVNINTIQFAKELPKTRSGKIMRRILRKIANKNFSDFGDLSTLNNMSVLEDIIKNRKLLDK